MGDIAPWLALVDVVLAAAATSRTGKMQQKLVLLPTVPQPHGLLGPGLSQAVF